MSQKTKIFRKFLFSSNVLVFWIYLIITIILLWPFIGQSGVPFRYDWPMPFFDLDYFRHELAPASNSAGLFSILSKNATGIFALFSLTHISSNAFLKIFMVTIHLLASFSFYLFIKRYVSKTWLAVIGGLAYAFTPYIFIRTVVGFTFSLLSYALVPFFLYYYFGRQNSKFSWWHYLIIGFIATLIYSQPQAGLLLSLFLVVNLIVASFNGGFWPRLRCFLAAHLGVIIFNLPWAIINQKTGSILNVVSGATATTLNSIANLPHSFKNIFMLSDHHITYQFFYALASEKIYLLGWLLIWLVALISIFNKKQRELVLTSLISILLILPFTKGPSGVFARFYVWFYSHFPQIAVFRETYHFEFLIAIAVVILFCLGASFLIDKIEQAKIFAQRSWQKAGIYTLLAGSTLFIIAPYFSSNYAGYLKLVEAPPEYYRLNQFIKQNPNFCSKAFYPPSLGFSYFIGDNTPGASNSDFIMQSLKLAYVTDGSSVLNLPDADMYYRNNLTSQFYEKSDQGQFADLLAEGGIDCLIVRTDIDTKYEQVSNLWRDPDSSVRRKWMNPNMLSLAKSKQGLVLDKQFGEKIYIFKIANHKSQITNKSQIQNINLEKTGMGAIQQFSNSTIIQLPITDWANQFDYYRDGWSRGRYAFWRKMLFAELRQDFIYTDKQGSVLTVKIDQRGLYEVWTRYLTGGTPGSFQLQITNYKSQITKDPGEERFVWKKLGDVDITDGKIEITNISGENAIADIVLLKK